MKNFMIKLATKLYDYTIKRYDLLAVKCHQKANRYSDKAIALELEREQLLLKALPCLYKKGTKKCK